MTSRQSPIASGLGPETTSHEVMTGIDLSGKTAIVTGGYSGLGLETVRALSKAGAKVLAPARSAARAHDALGSISGIEIAAMDLMDPLSIDAFTKGFLASGRPLHLLINSGGIMANPLTRDSRGYESQFSTNHLGHFQLAQGLWPAMERARGARVVALSSRAHRLAEVDFADPNFERRAYDRWTAYGQSKSANALFALGLDRRGEAAGIRSFSVHPGAVLTVLARNMSPDELQGLGAVDEHGRARIDPSAGLKSVEQGAATILWCATSAQLAGMGGVYCEDCDVAEAAPADHPEPRGVRPWAMDPGLAERLWSLSETLIAVSSSQGAPLLHRRAS